MKRYLTHPLGIFIILLHAIGFGIAWYTGSIYLVDSYGYLNQAKNLLAHGSWYAEEWNAPTLVDYFTVRPPLYAFFIVACKSIIASDYMVTAVQNMMSILNLFLLWKLLEQFRLSQKYINRVMVIALLCYPSQVIHANFIMTEILFQSLLMGVFYFSIQAYRTPGLISIFKIAVLLSLTMLTKPVIFLFGIVLFIYFFVVFRKHSKLILLPFLLLPVTYHVCCLQNQHTTGYYHYSSIKIMADLRVNARYIIADQYGEDSSSNFVTQVFREADNIPDYASRYKHIEQRCNEVYAQHKMTFFILYVKGVTATLIDPGRFDLFMFFGLQNNTTQGLLHRLHTEGISAITEVARDAPVMLLGYLLVILLWNLLVCIAFAFFVFDRKTDLLLRVLVLLFVGYIVAATGISGLCRYRVPVYPELIFGVALALPSLMQTVKRKTIHA